MQRKTGSTEQGGRKVGGRGGRINHGLGWNGARGGGGGGRGGFEEVKERGNYRKERYG